MNIRYEIRDAVKNAGGNPTGEFATASWTDAYSDDIQLPAVTAKQAIAYAETKQAADDAEMMRQHPGIEDSQCWGNAPCYLANLYQVHYDAEGDEVAAYKFDGRKWVKA